MFEYSFSICIKFIGFIVKRKIPFRVTQIMLRTLYWRSFFQVRWNIKIQTNLCMDSKLVLCKSFKNKCTCTYFLLKINQWYLIYIFFFFYSFSASSSSFLIFYRPSCVRIFNRPSTIFNKNKLVKKHNIVASCVPTYIYIFIHDYRYYFFFRYLLITWTSISFFKPCTYLYYQGIFIIYDSGVGEGKD